jgi:hypothetical protein
MANEQKQVWWEKIPTQVGGDVISADIGANAQGIAVGKNIVQTIYDALGEPTPDDKKIIEQQISQLALTVQNLAGKVDPNTAVMAKFQLELLQAELTKTDADETPSASTITKVGDWLLDTIPAIGEALASVFATPAVGKVVGKAGEAVVSWVKNRFGKGKS